MSDQHLISQLQTYLARLINVGQVLTNAGPDLYEAYAFEILIRAAAAEGFNVTFRQNGGAVASRLQLRTGPGFMERDVNTYVHARVSFPGREDLEVHVGIYVAGVSALYHECDLAVLRRREASWSRENRALPRSRGLLLGVECKYYSGGLGVDRARNFLGLSKEYKGSKLVSMANSPAVRPRKVLVHHGIDSEEQVMPWTPGDAKLQHLFQRFLADYALRETR